MKKSIFLELQTEAEKLKEKTISSGEFFGKLVELLREQLLATGLSESAIRYWTRLDGPEAWPKVKHEFQNEKVLNQLSAIKNELLGLSRKSHAFKFLHTDKIPMCNVKDLPLLSSILWKYHYRHLETPKKPAAEQAKFYEHGSPWELKLPRPWV